MSRFAFLVHPLQVEDLFAHYPYLRGLPPLLIEALLLMKRPTVVGRASEIRTLRTRETNQGIDGCFIAVPLTSRMIKRLPERFVRWQISRALRLADAERARVAGLGALLACVGDKGVTINNESPIPVTTGNSLTVSMAVHAATRLSRELFGHLKPSERVLGVVGATGEIGHACLKLLMDEFGEFILVVRDLDRGRVAADSAGLSRRPHSVVANPRFLREAHVVIAATSAESAVVGPADLSRGTFLLDVARPRDVSPRVAGRRDVLVIEGGIVRVPGLPDLGLDFGFPRGTAYACMAETMILAAEGLLNKGDYRAYTVGSGLSVDQVLGMGTLAIQHGFELAGYRSFERPVDNVLLEVFRPYAAQRRPRRVVAAAPAD